MDKNKKNSAVRYRFFNLPVNNLTMAQTKSLLRKTARKGNSVVLSTLNVNWVVESFRNPHFKAAIMNSEIVVLDGKPLLWLSKLHGYPMQEVVPGSTLIQELHQEQTGEPPLTIFLFGGEKGVAHIAMQRINATPGGLRAVGALNPGFGSVEELSTPDIIEAINRARPDILLVALGAKKGVQWIARNRHQLDARIISHLGATINFLAGTVQRAPRLIRMIGMEWAWRICQEPKLFSRYTGDGLVLLRLLIQGAY